MMRLSRIVRSPWAVLAGGSLALLGLANLASTPSLLRQLPWRAAERPTEPLNWVADASEYPPSLLRVPQRVPPARLPLANLSEALDGPRHSRGFEYPAGFYDTEGEATGPPPSVLRRLPQPDAPRAAESNLPVDDWRDERLPDFDDLDPPSSHGFGFAPPKSEGYPGAGGGFREEPSAPALEAPREPAPPLIENERVAAQPLPPSTETVVEHAARPNAAQSPSPVNSQAFKSVSERAAELTRHGFSLAERGAHYSARAEFVQALRLLTQALDGERADLRHSHALAAGLVAISEADDFVPKGMRLEADVNVAGIVMAHETPVLKNFNGRARPLAAVQQYYTFAQENLAAAGGRLPAASQALYGLGRVQLALAKESTDARRLAGPKAMTFYQAALLVDGRNHQAANELGVLLAKYGQLEDAKRVLVVGLSAAPAREAWHNLAVVHERLGETDLARRARHEEQLCSGGARVSPGSSSVVRWVDAREFSALGRGADSAAPPTQTAQPNRPQSPAAPKAAAKNTGFPWPWK